MITDISAIASKCRKMFSFKLKQDKNAHLKNSGNYIVIKSKQFEKNVFRKNQKLLLQTITLGSFYY